MYQLRATRVSAPKGAGRITEQQWHEIFLIRCRSKRGQGISAVEQKLCTRAWKEDPDRYEDVEVEVFNATVPFGSNVKRKR